MSEHEDTRAPNEDPADVDIELEEETADDAIVVAKLKKLRDELAKIKRERQEYLDGWQRCKADSVNMRRDADARAARMSGQLREGLVHDIIPALDSFDMAAESEQWADISDGWKSGMEQVRSQLIEALRQHGIERYGKVGDPFNHGLYEAVEERDDVPGEPGTVARILRYGYRSGERILRPAQVIVKSEKKS